MVEDFIVYGASLVVIITIAIFLKINRRRKIQEQVKRADIANQPWYRPPDDNMDAFIKDGVITYRKRRKK